MLEDLFDRLPEWLQIICIGVLLLSVATIFVLLLTSLGNALDWWPHGDCFKGCKLVGYENGKPLYDCLKPCGGGK